MGVAHRRVGRSRTRFSARHQREPSRSQGLKRSRLPGRSAHLAWRRGAGSDGGQRKAGRRAPFISRLPLTVTSPMKNRRRRPVAAGLEKRKSSGWCRGIGWCIRPDLKAGWAMTFSRKGEVGGHAADAEFAQRPVHAADPPRPGRAAGGDLDQQRVVKRRDPHRRRPCRRRGGCRRRRCYHVDR